VYGVGCGFQVIGGGLRGSGVRVEHDDWLGVGERMQTRSGLEPAGTRRINIAHASRDSDASATKKIEIRTTEEVGVYQESEGRREK